MNHGQPEINIPRVLDNLLIGERYTFYYLNAPNVGIRGTLINKWTSDPTVGTRDSIAFRLDTGTYNIIDLPSISRITQSYIAPHADGNLARTINQYLGGRKKRKSRKTKRRRRKTKRRRRKTKRRVKRRRKTRRR